jgi:hypothetical protein
MEQSLLATDIRFQNASAQKSKQTAFFCAVKMQKLEVIHYENLLIL